MIVTMRNIGRSRVRITKIIAPAILTAASPLLLLLLARLPVVINADEVLESSLVPHRHRQLQKQNNGPSGADGTIAILIIVCILFCSIWAPAATRRCRYRQRRQQQRGGGGGFNHRPAVETTVRNEAADRLHPSGSVVDAELIRNNLRRMFAEGGHMVGVGNLSSLFYFVGSDGIMMTEQDRREFISNCLMTKRVIVTTTTLDRGCTDTDDPRETKSDLIITSTSPDAVQSTRSEESSSFAAQPVVFGNPDDDDDVEKINDAGQETTQYYYADDDDDNDDDAKTSNDKKKIKHVDKRHHGNDDDNDNGVVSAGCGGSIIVPTAAPDSCTICLEKWVDGDEISWSHNRRCNHVFHRACIYEWLLSHEECPCCRNPFLAFDEDEEEGEQVLQQQPAISGTGNGEAATSVRQRQRGQTTTTTTTTDGASSGDGEGVVNANVTSDDLSAADGAEDNLDTATTTGEDEDTTAMYRRGMRLFYQFTGQSPGNHHDVPNNWNNSQGSSLDPPTATDSNNRTTNNSAARRTTATRTSELELPTTTTTNDSANRNDDYSTRRLATNRLCGVVARSGGNNSSNGFNNSDNNGAVVVNHRSQSASPRSVAMNEPSGSESFLSNYNTEHQQRRRRRRRRERMIVDPSDQQEEVAVAACARTSSSCPGNNGGASSSRDAAVQVERGDQESSTEQRALSDPPGTTHRPPPRIIPEP